MCAAAHGALPLLATENTSLPCGSSSGSECIAPALRPSESQLSPRSCLQAPRSLLQARACEVSLGRRIGKGSRRAPRSLLLDQCMNGTSPQLAGRTSIQPARGCSDPLAAAQNQSAPLQTRRMHLFFYP